MQDEPEITNIAKFIATRVPKDGVSHRKAVAAWRGSLRYARKAGVIEELVDRLKAEAPDDPSLHIVLDEAKR